MMRILTFIVIFVFNMLILFAQVPTRPQAAANAFAFTNEVWVANGNYNNNVNQWESNGCGTSINSHNFWLDSTQVQGIPYGYGGKDNISMFHTKMAEGNPVQLGGTKNKHWAGSIDPWGTIISYDYYIGRTVDSNQNIVVTLTSTTAGYGDLEIVLEWYHLSNGAVIRDVVDSRLISGGYANITYYNYYTGVLRIRLESWDSNTHDYDITFDYPSPASQDLRSPGWNKMHKDNWGSNPWFSWGTGVDCSGLIAHAWLLPNYQDVGCQYLYDHWNPINQSDVLQSDILVKLSPAAHSIFIVYVHNIHSVNLVQAKGLPENKSILTFSENLDDYLTIYGYVLRRYPLATYVSSEDVAYAYELEQNYPNPFNPITRISFAVPTFQSIKLEVYNVLGQKVKTIKDGPVNPGNHEVIWDGKDQHDKPVSSGVYYYRMSSHDFSETKKMILLR